MPVGEEYSQDQRLDAALMRAVSQAAGEEKIAVAVSGGGDSIALLHLLWRHAVQSGAAIVAVTVDHALRPEAALEAAGVARLCASYGIAHQTLRWDHGAISGNLMDQARQARRSLITAWARAQGIGRVAVGHTLDDEAETFLMALARGSGLDGLAGMRSHWREGGLQWLRPLLGQSRADLRAYLRQQGITWVDDPSNDDDSYTRVRVRKQLALLARLGITGKEISRSVSHLKQAQAALQDRLSAFAKAHVTEVAGALHITWPQFAALPDDLQRLLIKAAVDWLSAAPYPARGHKQLALLAALHAGRQATLGGCRFRPTEGALSILREARAVQSVECLTTEIWDNRWQITGPHAADLTIRALGAEGVRSLKDWRLSGISREALIVSPGIWRNSTLIAAPLAGFSNGWAAKPHRSFASFILSH